MNSEKGQSLLEVIIAMTVGILVVVALVFATIFSLRNASFAKNSAQATKLAQEGIERVRSARDRGSVIGGSFIIASGVSVVTSWQDPNLWAYSISTNCTPNCYFKFNGSSFQYLTAANSIPSTAEDPLDDGKFKRVITLSDDSASVPLSDGTTISSFMIQKTATVIVQWTDFAGPHESRLTTILRKL